MQTIVAKWNRPMGKTGLNAKDWRPRLVYSSLPAKRPNAIANALD